jgi:hypothetical protein
MCRLALINKEGMEYIEKTYGVKKFFNYLENSQGGHGNGICLIKNSSIVTLKKGVRFTNRKVVNLINKTDFDWCIYHTRLASIGSKTNKNCHPFKIGNKVLAMNGTENDYKLIAKKLDITDTEAILKVSNALKIDLVDFVRDLESVFIGFNNGKVFCTGGKHSSFKLKVVQEDNALIFASEFPSVFNYKSPSSFPFCWVEGDELILKEHTKLEDRYAFNKHLHQYRHFGWERYLDWDIEDIIYEPVDEIEENL